VYARGGNRSFFSCFDESEFAALHTGASPEGRLFLLAATAGSLLSSGFHPSVALIFFFSLHISFHAEQPQTIETFILGGRFEVVVVSSVAIHRWHDEMVVYGKS